MRLGRAEILDVVAGHLVGVSAKRRNFHTGEHGFERRRVHLDVPEDVFAAEQGWKEVVDRGEESIAAKLPGMAMALETELSATCKRCSRVRRGKMEDRPKPSVMLVI